jgi:hypothetical protein
MNKQKDITITKKQLRMLLFWASYGVCKASGGSYQKHIVPTIQSLAKDIRYVVDKPKFEKYL